MLANWPCEVQPADWHGTESAQNDNLQIHEDKARGVYIKNLSDFYVGSALEVYEIMRQGGMSRAVSSTSADAFRAVRSGMAKVP